MDVGSLSSIPQTSAAAPKNTHDPGLFLQTYKEKIALLSRKRSAASGKVAGVRSAFVSKIV